MERRRQPGSDARARLCWALTGFVLIQIIFNSLADFCFPELYDPEYGVRIASLRARRAENPDRPLLLLIGSSRTEMSFLPEKIATLHTDSGSKLLVFNFSHLGAGPVMNYLQVRRLLREGIRPEWLVVEMMPPQLADRKQSIQHDVATLYDLPVAQRCADPWRTYGYYVKNRLIPAYRHRLFFLESCMPRWVPAEAHLDRDAIRLGPLGGDYAWNAVPDADSEVIRQRTDSTRRGYFPPLHDGYRIGEMSDRAMHEMLELCRRERIQVTLLLTPEGREFQSWYAPEARRMIDAYCRQLTCQYQVAMVDARNWLAEPDFVDSHHVLLRGAEHFTQLLAERVLRPMVEGKLRAGYWSKGSGAS